MPRGVYERKPRGRTPKTIRTLRPGEPRPEGEPYRYADRNGYIRLRWKVGTGTYVEIREHRTIADDERHVHHLDHNPANNDPANLVVLAATEHAALHARERQKFEPAIAADLYRAGTSTIDIGRYFGVSPSRVSVRLRRVGVQMRPRRRYPVQTDVAEIIRLHLEGRPAAWIARQIGSTREIVARRIRWAGLTPHRPGRPENSRVA